MKRRLTLVATLVAAVLSPAQARADFAVDASFADDGVALTPIGWSSYFRPQAMLVPPDGTIVVGGEGVVGDAARPLLVRLRRSGLRDRDFGTRGEVALPLSHAQIEVRDVVRQSGGRLVALVVGKGTDNLPERAALVGLRDDGALDTAFGTGGTVDVGDFTEALAVDAADRLVTGGWDGEAVVTRHEPDGDVDTSFGSGGELHPGASQDAVYAVAMRPGTSTVHAFLLRSGTDDGRVARITDEGALDGAFDGDGIAVVARPHGGAHDLGVDAGGRVVVGTTHGVTRLTAGGATDTAFDAAASSLLGDEFGTTAIAVDPGGGVLLGSARYLHADDGRVERLRPDGTRDADFGTVAPEGLSGPVTVARTPGGGAASVSPSAIVDERADVVKRRPDGVPDQAFAGDGRVAVRAGFRTLDHAGDTAGLPDGRLVTTGAARFSDAPRAVLTRHRPDGSLDGSFGGCGVVAPEAWQGLGASSVVPQGDALVVALGGGPLGPAFGAGRVRADGTLDPLFGEGGTASAAVPGALEASPMAMAVDGLGRMVIVGYARSGPQPQLAATRLLPDGTVDPSFGDDGWTFASIAGRVVDAEPIAGGATYVTLAEEGGNDNEVRVVRLTAAGDMDETFGDEGLAAPETGESLEAVDAVTTADGGIVVAADEEEDGIRLVKLTALGVPDPAFGEGGVAALERRSSSGPPSASGLALDTSGRLLVAGTLTSFRFGYEIPGALVAGRVTATGEPDEAFGPGGWVTGPAPGHRVPYVATGAPIAQPGGRVLVAGSAGGPVAGPQSPGGWSTERGLVAFTEDGEPPSPPPAQAGTAAEACEFGPPDEPLGSAAEDPPVPQEPRPDAPAPEPADPPADPPVLPGPVTPPRPAAPDTPRLPRGFGFDAPARQRMATVLRRGLAVRVRCETRCVVRLTGRLGRARFGRTVRLVAGADRIIRVRLSREARARLRGRRRARLAVSAAAAGGPTHRVVVVLQRSMHARSR